MQLFVLGDSICSEINYSSKEFRLSSGGYEVQFLSQDVCKQLCHGEKFQFAGLLLGTYCFCGNAIDEYKAVEIGECNIPCSADEENFCGSYNSDLMLIIPVDFVGSVQSVTVKVDLKPFSTDEKVEIQVHVESSTAFLTQVDFGDGTLASTQVQDTTYEKQYVVPGKYQIRVFAVDVGKLNPPVFDDVFITVENEQRSFQLSCPYVTEPGFVNCFVSFYDGSMTTMSVNIKDEEKEYEVADPAVVPVGPAIPVFVTNQGASSPSGEVQLPYMAVMIFGQLVGFEYYGIQTGSLDFLVFKPSCDSGEYCAEEKKCVPECFPFEYKECGSEKALCSYIGDCIDSTSLPSCSNPPERSAGYEIRHTIPVDVLEGYQFFKIPEDSEFLVMPGDIFGFKINADAVMASRNSTNEDDSEQYYIRAIVIQPTNITLKREYDTVGNYSVSVIAKENEKSVYLPIQIPIMSWNLIIKPDRIAVGQEVTCEITVEGGSDMNLLWDFGNGTTEKEYVEGLAADENLSKSIVCNLAGNYVISVNASNLWNSTEATAEFDCYGSITREWTLESDSPQSTPPGKVTITLAHGNVPLPSAAKFTIDFGDGESKEPELINTLEDPADWNKVWIHPYSKNGSYDVVVNISNPIESEVFTVQVVIVEKIGELTAVPYFLKDVSSPNEKQGLKGRHKTDVPVNSVVYFVCNLTGYVTSYLMKLDEQEVQNITTNILTYIPKETGEWTVDLYGWNPIDEYSNNVTFQIRALDEVQDVVFKASTEAPEVEEEVIFTIILSNFDSYTCLMFDGGDGGKKQAFGNKDVCTIDYNPNDFKFNGEKFSSRRKREATSAEWESDSTIKILYEYTYGGLFPASLDAFNTVSRKKSRINIEVSDGDYLSPLLWIDNNSTDIAAPLKRYRGENFRLETTALFRDNSSYFVAQYWTLYKLDDKGNEVSEIDLSILPTVNCSAIRFPKRFFEIGMYKLWYTLAVHPESENPSFEFIDEDLDEVEMGENYYNQYTKEQKLQEQRQNSTEPYEPSAYEETLRNFSILGGRSCFTYLEIIPTPLIPTMIQGGASYVVRGFGQAVDLEPTSLTIDPDDTEQSDYNVLWFCKRFDLNENLNEIDSPRMYSDGTPSGPILDRSNVDNNGGCFGKGPGLMEIGSGNYILKTDTLWNYGATYEINSVISAAGKVIDARLLIQVIEKRPPSLRLGCEKAVACYPTMKGQLVNPNSWLSLKAECIEDCGEEGEIQYSWKVFASNLETIEKNPIEAESHIIADGERLGINSSLYQAYPEEKIFLIEVSAKLQDSDIPEGQAALLIKLNNPPEGGKCSIDVTSGLALIDIFKISYLGWKDPEGHDIEDYSLYVQVGNNPMHLEYGMKEKVSVILPYGDLKMWCAVTDEYGATATQAITDFKTLLPSKDDFDKFEEFRSFDRCLAEGKMSMASQIILARNSVIEYYLNGTDKYEVSDAAINAKWEEYLKLDGIDSSYYTPQAREEIREELEDQLRKQINKDAKLKNKELDKLLTIPMDAIEDVEVFGGAMASTADNGPTNKDANGKIMESIQNMFRVINETEKPSPLDKKMAFATLGETADSMAGNLADSMIGGKFVPSDMRQAVVELDYNSTEPNYFINFVNGNRKEVEERLENRAIGAAKSDQSDAARDMVQGIKDMVSTLQRQTMEDILVGQAPFHTESEGGFQITAVKKKASELAGSELQQGDSSVVLPDACAILGTEACKDKDLALGVQSIRWTKPLESYAPGSMNLSSDSNVLQIAVTNRDGDSTLSVKDTTEPFVICIAHEDKSDGTDDPEFKYVEPKFEKDDDILVYHELTIDSLGVVVHVELKPDKPSAPLIIVYKYGNQSALNDYDGLVQLKDLSNNNSTFKLVIGAETFTEAGKALSVGIGHLGENTDPNFISNNGGKYNLSVVNMTNNFSTNYKIKITTTGCYYFDEQDEQWKLDGCEVVSGDASRTCCECNHLTSFSSGFFTPPNTIDFSYVFANAGFDQHNTIYIILIVTFSLFILIVIYAAWKDRKDIEKLGASPLPDNDAKDKYLYEIVIFTGHQRNAGTKSKVYFIASGEDDETEVRHLADDKRPVLQSGSIDTFVMAVPRSLGQMNYLRLWHDNSGKGKWSSWNVQNIIFRDVQTGHQFEFLIDRWFAVEEDDGMIDRLIPVAGKEQITEFSHLFATQSRRNFADSHLWLSVFFRPARSRFTRVQRVSCCFAVLYLSMLTNAMYYERTTPQPNSGGFKFGPFSLSPEQIVVGLITNFIVFPPSVAMIFFFRKSRLRKLRPSRIEEAVKRQREEWKKANPNTVVDDTRRNRSDEEAQIYHRKKKFSMPWWCIIFGWLFVFASIGASVFFLWAYAISFGNEKTTKWLTSLLIAFVSSLLITQPIKIVLMTILVACICRNVDDNDDVDEDEEDPRLEGDEAYLHQNELSGKRPKRRGYRPMDMEALEAARKEREKEVKMFNVMREVTAYFVFLWIVMILSFGNRDTNNFYLREALINGFIKPGDLFLEFNNVNTEVRFWNWTYNALISELFAAKWYNGNPPLGLRLYLDDRSNFKIGYAVMRQIRSKPKSCSVHPIMKEITPECAGYGQMIFEDGNIYTKHWKRADSPNTLAPNEYKYLSASQLKGYPFWGAIDWYGGGGYVVPLLATTVDEVTTLTSKLKILERDGWVDKHTRAIFVEIATYNAQVNLFCALTIVAEFVPGGGIVPYYHIDPVRLLNYHTGFGLFIIIIEILFVIFTLFFTVREILNMVKQGKSYFTQYWNIAEIASILASYAMICIRVAMLFLTAEILRIFNETEGTGYVKLQESVLLNDIQVYLIGFVMSISTLKFLKLLRFNRRIGMLSSTLRLCAQELQSYSVCLLVVFTAFVILFWLLLGRTVREFSTFVSSFEASISMMLKKFDYESMQSANPFLTPVAFFSFSLATAVVLINILLSIIIRSFEDVKHDESLQGTEYEIWDYFVNWLRMTLGCGKVKVRPQPSIFKDMEMSKKKDHVSSLNDKVDRLADFINDFYFENQMDFNSKEFLKKMNSNTDGPKSKKKAIPNKVVQNSQIPKSVRQNLDDF